MSIPIQQSCSLRSMKLMKHSKMKSQGQCTIGLVWEVTNRIKQAMIINQMSLLKKRSLMKMRRKLKSICMLMNDF